MIRTAITLVFIIVATPLAALVAFPWTFIAGNVDFLYWIALSIVRVALRIAGVRVKIIGRERLDPKQCYLFMSNHVSNLDPPILVPNLPGRTTVLVKKELFKVPVLGRAMRMASLVPVDRSNREAALASLKLAAEVLRRENIHMAIYPEGTRSPDGRLLPFKKGPFYLALETGFPIVPVTIFGTREMMPKGRLRIMPGTATLVFHEPVAPADVPDREQLMEVVAEKIASALPVS